MASRSRVTNVMCLRMQLGDLVWTWSFFFVRERFSRIKMQRARCLDRSEPATEGTQSPRSSITFNPGYPCVARRAKPSDCGRGVSGFWTLAVALIIASTACPTRRHKFAGPKRSCGVQSWRDALAPSGRRSSSCAPLAFSRGESRW